MKKTYIEPTNKVVELKTRKMILTTSLMSVGADISSGEADARDYDFEDEEY